MLAACAVATAAGRAQTLTPFAVTPEDWWHFDFMTWQSYALGNIPFDAHT